MANNTRRTQTRHTNAGKQNRERYDYVYGTAARKLQPAERTEEHGSTGREVHRRTHKEPDRAVYMNLGYVLFLAAALISAGFILIGYIRIQAQITVSAENIAALESELNSLKLSNDEEYKRIESKVDLEEIRSVAIGELGMRYAKEGQIINITGVGSDYVRQLEEIGN